MPGTVVAGIPVAPSGAGPLDTSLDGALARLVARGVISAEQRDAVLGEVNPPGTVPTPGGSTHRRSLTQVLIEVGLYVGSALVVAAAFVLAAQNWGEFARGMQIAVAAAAALISAMIGLIIARGADPGSARRRLAGVFLAGTAISAAGTVALAFEGFGFVGTAAGTAALLVMVGAHLAASSAVTELGMFAASFMTIQMLISDVTSRGDFYDELTTTDRLAPLAALAFGLIWALVVAPLMAHREVAVFLGMVTAVTTALGIVSEEPTRVVGLVVLALIAVTGFWRFLTDGMWPWLAAAVASVTGFVFWAVGGQRPALAILVAGLVMLGSSAAGLQVSRRRRRAVTLVAGPPAVERID